MYKLAVVLVLVVGCTKKADQCTSNADCSDPAYPFCDVNGAFPASGGSKNVCTITPTDCPVETCGCTAGSATCGSDGTLAVCNADGMSVTTTSCALGCELPAATCKAVIPSNGLGSAFAGAGDAAAIDIPDGSTIDTDSGVVLDANGQAVAVASSLVMQSSGVPIRVFAGMTVSVGTVSIVGADPVAFVSAGAMMIGNIDAAAYTAPGSGDAGSGGPGAVTMGDCVGSSVDPRVGGPGGGGGGDATAGGSGGGYKGSTPGGLAATGFDLLVGGCSGGGATYADLSYSLGGGGGGAIQLVSGSQLTLNGVIDVGGGGGEEDSGGGAGGMVIIEAPMLAIASTGGIAANGGGGGGICNGANGPVDMSPALGGLGGSDGSACGSDGVFPGGAGGTATLQPGPGDIEDGPVNPPFFKGGGGGAVGRARIETLDGTYMSSTSSVVSVVITTDMLVLQ